MNTTQDTAVIRIYHEQSEQQRPLYQASIDFNNLEHDEKMLLHSITLKHIKKTVCKGINLCFILFHFHYITFRLITNLFFCFPLQTHRGETSVCTSFFLTLINVFETMKCVVSRFVWLYIVYVYLYCINLFLWCMTIIIFN